MAAAKRPPTLSAWNPFLPGLDPPFLKDDGSPVTAADAAAVEAAEARAHGGHAPKGGLASAAQVRQAAWGVEQGAGRVDEVPGDGPTKHQHGHNASAQLMAADLPGLPNRRRLPPPTGGQVSLRSQPLGRCWLLCRRCTRRQAGARGQLVGMCSWRDGRLMGSSESLQQAPRQAADQLYYLLSNPPAEELPTLEEARALQAVEQEELGHNPKGGMAAKVRCAARASWGALQTC